MTDDDVEVVFTVDQVAEANTALRTALGRPPEHFTLAQFIGMVSDEIDQLLAKGWGHTEIATLLAESTGSIVSADNIAAHYAPAGLRGLATHG